MKEAKPRLSHIETDLLNNFRKIGVQTKTLDGIERLRLMHAMFHPDNSGKFCFDSEMARKDRAFGEGFYRSHVI